MEHVFVTIPVAATWPTREELILRNAITDSLESLGIGTFTGAGGGMGEMDFSFQVHDVPAFHVAVETAMQSHLPGAKFCVRVSK